MDILNIENCTIRYQEQEAAVEHVSLSVGEQEIVSIVGESGSGKTTLIRAILGILSPGGTVTEGKILFQGKNILELDPGNGNCNDLSGCWSIIGSHTDCRVSISGIYSGAQENGKG